MVIIITSPLGLSLVFGSIILGLILNFITKRPKTK